MRIKFILILLVVLVANCSLIWNPKATVNKYIAASQRGDVEAMTELYSSKALELNGRDKIRSINQSFVDDVRVRAPGAEQSYQVRNVTETTFGDTARVSILYRSDVANDSIGLVFDLSKEGSSWKIDNIRGAGPAPADLKNSATEPIALPESLKNPPPLSNSDETKPSGQNNEGIKTISAGVLNGKATSLPKPSYPPVARAAKASGTVVVQVTVDENGNVISASAVSGHPLLRASAVAAARAAKFSPTRLSGKPVKVTGVITYNFTPE